MVGLKFNIRLMEAGYGYRAIKDPGDHTPADRVTPTQPVFLPQLYITLSISLAPIPL